MTKNVYELTPFNIDNNKNISIKSYIDGSFFIEKAKANSEAFENKNYKTKVLFNNFDHPGISKCDICYNSKYGDRKGVGLMSNVMCTNNEFNPNYDSDYDTGSDYINCWVFIRANETKDEWKKRVSKNT